MAPEKPRLVRVGTMTAAFDAAAKARGLISPAAQPFLDRLLEIAVSIEEMHARILEDLERIRELRKLHARRRRRRAHLRESRWRTPIGGQRMRFRRRRQR